MRRVASFRPRNARRFFSAAAGWAAVSLLTPVAVAAAAEGTISGLVYDEVTGKGCGGAVVAVAGTDLFAVADVEGYYLLSGVPAGTCVLKFTLIGYAPRAVTDVVVTPGRRVNKNVPLTPAAAGVAVIRSEEYFAQATEVTVSAYAMNKEEIRRQPGGAGDIYRVLASMPGVNGADVTSDLVVRGGDPNENLTVLDGVELFNPVHYGQTYGANGAITALPLELLEDAAFYAGGFPANYGDRMSGVVALRLREGDRSGYHCSGDLSMAGVGAIAEGPLTPRGSFVASGRRSYLEVLSRITDFAGTGGSVPQYHDWLGKTVYDLTKRHRVSALGFYAADRIRVPEDKEYAQSYGADWYADQAAWALGWRWLYADAGELEVTAFRTGNHWNIHGYNDFAEQYEETKGYENVLKAEARRQLRPGWIADAGGALKYVTLSSRTRGVATFTGSGEPVNPFDRSYHPEAFKGYGFSQIGVTVGRARVVGGVRADHLAFTGETTWSPRVGARVAVSGRWDVNVAYGRYYQSPSYVDLAMNDASAGPPLHSGRADHYVVGASCLLRPDFKAGVEVYHKNLYGLPTVALDNGEWVVRNLGSGYARGCELYYHKKLSGRLFTRGTYSYCESRRRLRRGQPLHPSSYEVPHSFTILAGYEAWPTWVFSGKFKWASGTPYTPVVGRYYDEGLRRWFRVDGDVNSGRYPPYRRFDLRIDKASYHAGWSLTWYFDFQNVTGAKNVLTYRYNYDYSRREAEYQWGMMPVGGVVVEF